MAIDKFAGEFSFLSNFHPAPIVFEGIQFPTSEHAFQAAKTLDHAERQKIAWLDTPGKAKRAGRKVTLQPNWDIIKGNIMRTIVRAKFQQNPDLAAQLVATGDAELIEGNNWGDTFWGVCRGKGRNILGKILQQVRAELKADQP